MKSCFSIIRCFFIVLCCNCLGIVFDDFISSAKTCNDELCFDLTNFNIFRTTYNTANHSTLPHACDDYCKSIFRRRGASDTVIIFTTCNHLAHSITALDSISHASDAFDVIVIDDYSIDGTQSYLRKKGYFVLSSHQPMGLTHSWNIGYRIAKYLAYKYVIFANNDILIPSGAVDALRRDLIAEALVVPLTTLKGAGHNPSQNINRAHDINLQFNRYTYDPSNTQTLQNMLSALCDKKENRTIVSESKSGIRFNGFFFAVNLELMEPAAYDNLHLFDPTTIMVEQENRLMEKMLLHNLIPKISLCSFVFHFKSVTVKVAQYSSEGNETREDLSLYHPDHSLDNDELPTSQHINIDHMIKPTFPAQRLRPILAIVAEKRDTTIAKELGYSLSSQYHVDVRYINKNELVLNDVDVLLSLYSQYLVTKIEHAKPTLLLVAWMLHSFDRYNFYIDVVVITFRWLALPWLGNYDVLLTSSTGSAQQMQQFPRIISPPYFVCIIPSLVQGMLYSRSPIQLRRGITSDNISATVLRPAVNANVHRKLQKPTLDFVFIGRIDDVVKAMFSHNLEKMSLLHGVIIPVHGQQPMALPITYSNITVRNKVTPMEISELVKASRVLVVHVESFAAYWGEHDALMLEAASAGTLVLTNDWNAHNLFGDDVPLYASPADFSKQLFSILRNKEKRNDIINSLQRHVVTSHTYTQRAVEFRRILRDAGYALHNRSSRDEELIPLDNTPAICISVIVLKDDEGHLMSILQRFLFMRTLSSHSVHLDLLIHLTLHKGVNKSTVEKVVKQLNSRFHRSVVYIFQDTLHSFSKKMTQTLHEYNTLDSLLHHHMETSKCSWTMMTASNIEYYSNWFDSVAAHIVNNENLMVLGWYKHATYLNGLNTRPVTVVHKTALLMDHIDLSSVIIRTSALRSTSARLLPMAMLTPYLDHREVIFLHNILGYDFRETSTENVLHGTEISNYYVIGTPLMKKYIVLD